MPTSRAARTQAWAASSSTWLPWVSQLPYEISEMFRPERPSRLNSTSADSSPAEGIEPDGPLRGAGRERASGGGQGVLPQTSAPTATSGLGNRQRRIIVDRLIPYQTT